MTRFAVSAEFVRPGRVGGLEQALGYMMSGLADGLAPDDELTLIGGSLPAGGQGIAQIQPPTARSNRFAQETETLFRLGKTFDSYFLPNYFTPPIRQRCRVVTMIPDLQYRHYPDNFSRQKRLWLSNAHRFTMRAADAVAVFSEFVREDLLDRYPKADPELVVNAPLPVDWGRFGSPTTASPSPRPYVLTVASHYRHKNLRTLLRAFAKVHAESPDVELVMVGQVSSNLIGVAQADDICALVDQYKLEGHVRVTGYIDDLSLGHWYRHAELFVFPSVFEGFGLPPVEALGLGLPVITTGCASLPEVTRGLATYVDDPYDADELASRITAALESNDRPSSADVSALREHYRPRIRGSHLLEILRG